MIFSLFRKNAANDAVYAIYSAIVAQSRQPRFYAEWGVPDTVTGRFDMICLHLALLFRRLKSEGKSATTFSQAVFDLFFKDMDRSLREMGVTDMGVPKKIKKMTGAFYSVLGNLSEALDSGDRDAVAAVVGRSVFESETAGPDAQALADYLMAEGNRLNAVPVQQIVAGRLEAGVAA